MTLTIKLTSHYDYYDTDPTKDTLLKNQLSW